MASETPRKEGSRRWRAWLRDKWENVEAWLPWFLGSAASLVLIVGLAVGFLRSNTRAPAGFVEVADSEVPASEVYSEETTESLGGKAKVYRRAAREQASSGRANRSFVIALNTVPSDDEIFARTGVRPARARAVVMTADILSNRAPKQEMSLRIELFPDVAPVFQMRALSEYQVNQGMHSGTAPDDPASRADITTAEGSVSAFITYHGTEYRIVADPTRGVHYIIEVKK